MGTLSDLGARLKEERERLGLNQLELAQYTSINRNSQSAYETAKTPPTVEYLYAIEKAGVDLGYLLWGVRSERRISAEESDLLACYDAIDAHERESLLTVAGALAGRARPRRPAPAPADPLAHIPPAALEETLFRLLDGIESDEPPTTRARLLAERLPSALSLLRDLRPAAPPVPASPQAQPPAKAVEPATPGRGRRP